MRYLGIDVGGTFTKYAVMDENGQIFSKSKVKSINENIETFIKTFVDIFDSVDEKIDGIALSVPGMIDHENGVMLNGGSFKFINNFNIVKELEDRLSVPVSVENDAKSAALAELWKGSLKGYKNAVTMVCGTGIGGAIIMDGKVLRGMNFMSGEFSYLITNSNNPTEFTNMFGFKCSVPALVEKVGKLKGIEEEIDGEKVFEMANNGDEEVIQCIREYAKHLAVQITNLQYTFDQEVTTIGGGISAQKLLIDLVREELVKINEAWIYELPVPDVTVCEFFNDSNIIGALYAHLKSTSKL